ncbi:hypothetical protein B0H21DRAFT_145688 [Amylocystis lapponica]|nr:hypothetical protein B0H21DRAFT_145688 [Amylocystis lapponica]
MTDTSALPSPSPSSTSLHDWTDLGDSLSATTIPAEVSTATDLISTMKGSLGHLGSTFDALGEQTMQMIQLGGELETAQYVKSVRKQMHAQDSKHEKQIDDIKELLQEVLQNDIIEHLRVLSKFEGGVMEQIDQLVEEQVAELLPQYISQELQDEVAYHRQQLDEVQRALHNSESRRANAQLRTTRMDSPLNTIYTTDGNISLQFPKDLNALFSMDAETAQVLIAEYGLGDPSDMRERNINRLMQFCGLPYRLVRKTPPSSASPS